ncbi:hypothetical protein CERZMDRAFT_93442 [Cercospora zeae-maydis SCOH1-5]|uniref:Uncharacterized protein n=1 Tax=Cercospora zeae-maydis SCOH1-5 TaxID=717836 RepID=A0A6A6FRM5_9PEZI|nr:hypothetical protein CERZMDRAFT_93442 [Cercospora zeae-maydis SCOH1-5]
MEERAVLRKGNAPQDRRLPACALSVSTGVRDEREAAFTSRVGTFDDDNVCAVGQNSATPKFAKMLRSLRGFFEGLSDSLKISGLAFRASIEKCAAPAEDMKLGDL